MSLRELDGTRWEGQSELWLDPEGNVSERGSCTLEINTDEVAYTWVRGGDTKSGLVEIRKAKARFQDSFHQPEPMVCRLVESWGLFSLFGTYAVGQGPRWGWGLVLSVRPRPNRQLVLRMTNFAPWGEETRAMRMTVSEV